jgi:hypothetical protein
MLANNSICVINKLDAAWVGSFAVRDGLCVMELRDFDIRSVVRRGMILCIWWFPQLTQDRFVDLEFLRLDGALKTAREHIADRSPSQ